LVAISEEPLLYLILSAEPQATSDTLLSAMLLTAGSPLRSEYRTATQFVMRRTSDGRPFAWHARERRGAAPFDFRGGFAAGAGNYVLADTAEVEGLGRRDLTPGDTYVLSITTGAHTISGRVVMPGHPTPRVVQRDGQRMIVWAAVAGAAGYIIQADTDRGTFGKVITDTTYALREDRDPESIPPNPRFRLTALDSNVARFVSDARAKRAGIDAGYGVFGAVSVAELALPSR
jgi:hypothetical protein